MSPSSLIHNRPHLYMFVGYPGSGKSTFRNSLLLKHSQDLRCTTVLSSDDYIEETAVKSGQTYQQVFQEYIDDALKDMQKEKIEATKNKDNIIWDQTNLSKKTRRKKMSQFPKEYYKVAVYFDTDWSIIEKINEERHEQGRAIPSSILNSMIVEPPELNEGFDTIITVKR